MSDARTISDESSPKLPWDVFPETGDDFAGYVLGDVIGKGSFGTVFRVQADPDIEWYEAVKVLHRSGEVDKQSFHEEIKRLKEIRLPGIARIHAAGEEAGFLYYCMDYVDGLTIDEYVEADNSGALFPLFIELCNIVQNLHSQNFIHLDIKPHNVMVTTTGEVRLLDFGISRRQGDPGKDGFGAGTYEFASPEQISGDAPDASMDVYALACLLYTLLTSAHPKIPFDPLKRQKPYGCFYPKAIDRSEVTRYCLSHDLIRIAEYQPLVSSRLAACVEKGLSCREMRYSTIKTFREDLQKCGVLLPVFYMGYSITPKIVLRVLNILDELSLEFAGQLQIIPVQASKDINLQMNVIVSDDKAFEHQNLIVIADTSDFSESLTQELRGQIYEQLEIEDEEAWSHSPYKSLSSYREEEAHLFYGRDREVGEFCQVVDQSPNKLFALLAPSGAGKSSFMQAGVIPFIKQSSAKELLCEFFTPRVRDIDSLRADLKLFLKKEYSQKLLIVDQFEEVFQQDSQLAGQLADIASLLRGAIEAPECTVILSLRNDFYKEYISFLDTYSLTGQFYNLPQPDAASISRMIRMPALKAHLTFEKDPGSGRGLDDLLREEAMINTESLAALSFTLDEIFQKSPKGRMSYGAYKKLGGMHGALAKRAENLFKELNLSRPQMTFHKVFHQLIQVDENKISRRLYAPYKMLAVDQDSKKLSDEFIKAKLFQVTKDKTTDRRMVTVSHEALIQQSDVGWPRLMGWLNYQRNNLQLRKRLAVAVREWQENGQAKPFLYSGYSKLGEIQQLRKSDWAFSDDENEFIRRSYKLWIRNALSIGISIIILILVSFNLWRESNNVDNLTTERNAIRADVSRLKNEADRQLENLGNLQSLKNVAQDQLRLSMIASLQQNSALPAVTGLKLLSEIHPESRNWQWGRLLYNSLPNYRMLFGHQEEILSVEFSHDPQSRYLVTSSWDNSVILWDGKSGEKKSVLNYDSKSKGDFEDARFSYDGYIVAANNDGHIYVWTIEDALKGISAKAYKLPHDRIRKLFFSRDNKYLLCCDSVGTFSIWDWQQKDFQKPLSLATHSVDLEKRLYSAVLAPDGKSVVTAGWDKTIKKWSWDGKDLGPSQIVGRHAEEIWWGEFSPDGKYYISAGKDRVAKLWDSTTFELLREFGELGERHRSDVMCATFSPDSKTLMTCSRDKKIKLWDVESGKLKSNVMSHDNYIYCVSFSEDGLRTASSSADKLINLYDSHNLEEKPLERLRHSDSVNSFDVFRSKMVTASSDGEIRLWSLGQKAMVSHTLHGDEVPRRIFFSKEDEVISSDRGGQIVVWQIDGGDWQKKKTILNEDEGDLVDLVISQDKKYIAASFTAGIKIWSLTNYQLLYNSKVDELNIENLTIYFCEDSKKLVCGDDSGRVFVFDWMKRKMISEWQHHERKVFGVRSVHSPQGERIISCSRDGRVIVSDLKGKEISSISHGVRGDAVYASMSSDGRFMATSSARNNSVFVWDIKNNLELLPLSGHEEPINQVEFFGDVIISASRDGDVKFWSSLSWKKLRSTLSTEEQKASPLSQLQKAVWIYQNN